MMKILFLEDDAALRRHIADSLFMEQFTAKECRGIDEANEYLDECANDIDCIITDLHMNGEWLDEEYQADTDGYLMTGWVWLEHYVWSRNELKNKYVVIFSGFTEDLKMYLRKRGEEKKLNNPQLSLVEKGGKGTDVKSIRGLREVLKSINQLINGDHNERQK